MSQKRNTDFTRIQISLPTKWVDFLDQRLINRSAMILQLFEKYLIQEVKDLNSPEYIKQLSNGTVNLDYEYSKVE